MEQRDANPVAIVVLLFPLWTKIWQETLRNGWEDEKETAQARRRQKSQNNIICVCKQHYGDLVYLTLHKSAVLDSAKWISLSYGAKGCRMNVCEAWGVQAGQQMTDDPWELTEAQTLPVCHCVSQVLKVSQRHGHWGHHQHQHLSDTLPWRQFYHNTSALFRLFPLAASNASWLEQFHSLSFTIRKSNPHKDDHSDWQCRHARAQIYSCREVLHEIYTTK